MAFEFKIWESLFLVSRFSSKATRRHVFLSVFQLVLFVCSSACELTSFATLVGLFYEFSWIFTKNHRVVEASSNSEDTANTKGREDASVILKHVLTMLIAVEPI
jgi:hypothetical protein